jgi:uncharacterized protein YcnI
MSLSHGAIAVGLALLFAGPAASHVTLEVGQAQANSIYRTTFRIPHGRSGFVRLRARGARLSRPGSSG